jgi:putative OPT family oligopeptide transporter
MTICALLLAAAIFLGLGMRGESAVLATLGVAGVVCCAACTAGDIAQDLKTGILVGATPRRQQWGEVIGAVVPAFIIAPVLAFLDDRFTIGSQELAAPQASLFAHLAGAFFGDGPLRDALPWDMVGAGMLLGAALAVGDYVLRARGSRVRVHVMPVAVGMYLPFTLAAAMFAGGLLRLLVDRTGRGHRGVLFASGLIAGEALVSIGIAIPASLNTGLPRLPAQPVLSVAAFAAVLFLLGVSGRRRDA